MHRRGDRDGHNSRVTKSSYTVGKRAVDAVEHTQRILHLPAGLRLLQSKLVEGGGKLALRAADAEGSHLDCRRTDIEADDDFSLTSHVCLVPGRTRKQVMVIRPADLSGTPGAHVRGRMASA
jgi:hypothetical protein